LAVTGSANLAEFVDLKARSRHLTSSSSSPHLIITSSHHGVLKARSRHLTSSSPHLISSHLIITSSHHHLIIITSSSSPHLIISSSHLISSHHGGLKARSRLNLGIVMIPSPWRRRRLTAAAPQVAHRGPRWRAARRRPPRLRCAKTSSVAGV
jgi:hypothetical protein